MPLTETVTETGGGSLTDTPIDTTGTAYGDCASGTLLAAGASGTPIVLDFRAVKGGTFSVEVIGTTIGSPSGLQMQCFKKVTGLQDTVYTQAFAVPAITGTNRQSFDLGKGLWVVVPVNLDTVNAVKYGVGHDTWTEAFE